MCEFVVSFLIGFIFPKLNDKSKQKSPKAKGKHKEKQNNKAPIVEVLDNVETVDPNVIKCGNKKEICHVTYSLMPFEVFPVHCIDIVCWDTVTKIFTKEDVSCVKSYKHEGVTWVSFSVHHKFCKVSDEDINALLSFEVCFKFSQSPNELMTYVKNDTPKEFHLEPVESETKSDDTETIFKTVYQTEPPIEGNNEIKRREIFFAEPPKKKKIMSLLCSIPFDMHQKTIVRKINLFEGTQQATEPVKSVSLKNKDKKGKKVAAKKGKVEPNTDKSTLRMKAELLFREGKLLSIENTEPLSPSLAFTGVFITVKNLLTNTQRNKFNPIQLEVRQLSNLPQDIVDKYRIKQVFCEYVFHNIIPESVTPRIELKNCKENDFNYSTIFFMNPTDEDSTFQEIGNAFLKFEALQTGRLIFKVFGVTSIPNEEVVPCVFGERITDPFISSRHHELFSIPNKRSVVLNDGLIALGTAVFNFFPVTEGAMYYSDFVTLTSLPVFIADPVSDAMGLTLSKVNCVTLHEQHNIDYTTPPGDIPEAVLLELSTSLQVNIKVTVPVLPLPLHQILNLPSVYSRIVVIFKDIEVAAKIVQKIQIMNYEVLGSHGFLYPFFVSESDKKKHYEMRKSQHDDEMSLLNFEPRKSWALSLGGFSTVTGSEDWIMSPMNNRRYNNLITGFFIDNFVEGILIVEGLTNLTFPRVYAHIYALPVGVANVIYNSDIIFSKRLYSEMSNFGGVYIVTLGMPLQHLLEKSSLYLEGNVPAPAQKALLQLDLLRKSSTMHSVCKMQLFPSSQQILSFEIEFGVKLRMCGIIDSVYSAFS